MSEVHIIIAGVATGIAIIFFIKAFKGKKPIINNEATEG